MIYRLGEREPVFEGNEHFVADNATLVGSVRLGEAASVWFGSILRGDNDWIVVGPGSNVQDGSVLHTDPGIPLEIGEGVTVGHKVMLHGCTVGANSLVGIGSVLLNHATIGRDCIVGANSLITEGKSFPDGVLIMGSPARVVRDLTAEEIGFNRWSAEHYVENARRYRDGLVACESAAD